MKSNRPIRATQPEAGYALLMVVFLVALMAIGAATITPNLITQSQREKEEEMIWRGEQYTRAVRVFYRKNGRFPQSVEDLTEKKFGNIRYLRQAYVDPMNKEDGSWRFIYVGPGGQLIGSVTRVAAIQFGPAPGQPAAGQQPGKAAGPTPFSQPTPVGGTPVGGPIIGGNIIGVGSKVNKSSLKVYNGREVYSEWEFIWDPTKDAPGVGTPIAPGAPGQQPQQPQQPQNPLRPPGRP